MAVFAQKKFVFDHPFYSRFPRVSVFFTGLYGKNTDENERSDNNVNMSAKTDSFVSVGFFYTPAICQYV